MKKKVLIITHTNDNSCIETVSEAIEKNGGQAIRFDIDRYPLDYTLTSKYINGKWELILREGENEHYLLTEFAGLWNRRFYHLGQCLADVVEEQYYGSCVGESHATLIGFLTHLEREIFTFNSYSINRISSIKEDQLRMATEFGLKIPKTCITNDAKEAKAFIESCPGGAISKMQHAFSIDKEGEESVVYTNVVTEKELEQMEGLQYSPMKFQEKIEKQLELRITVIGNRLFTAALDSQVVEGGKTDWRKVGYKTVKDWVPYADLPKHIETQLLELHNHYKLNYGAADIILTPEGEYVFLESNPGGEFFWLDRLIDFEISDEIAKLLLGISEQRPHHCLQKEYLKQD